MALGFPCLIFKRWWSFALSTERRSQRRIGAGFEGIRCIDGADYRLPSLHINISMDQYVLYLMMYIIYIYIHTYKQWDLKYTRHAKSPNKFCAYSTASAEESRGKNDERCGWFVCHVMSCLICSPFKLQTGYCLVWVGKTSTHSTDASTGDWSNSPLLPARCGQWHEFGKIVHFGCNILTSDTLGILQQS